jgi:polysaccharide deacetylase family protein (PEP-CTERM system associated)
MSVAAQRITETPSPAVETPGAPAVTYHHFTVDVEEYFQVSAFERIVPRSTWDGMSSRVLWQTRRLMEMMAAHDARGTFFVLGWIAERYPGLVGEIAERGHEVASHGWDHARVTTLTPASFADSVRRSKALLESITGQPVLGFRAPSFSIVPGLEWALDILRTEGYEYDSSLFPVRRRGYGYPGGGRDPYWIDCPSGTLIEMPPVTLRRAGVNLPAAGGGYLRLLPPSLMRAAVASSEQRHAPATLYIHPWEIDPGQPRLEVSWMTAVRHYGGLKRSAQRIDDLLSRYRFLPMSETLARMKS